MKWLSTALAKMFAVLASLFAAKQLGKSEARREQFEQSVKEMKKDAEIAEDYRHFDLDSAKRRMRRKVRKHTS